MYALNIGADNRVLSATYHDYAPKDWPRVSVLPEGDVYEYIYHANGTFEHNPLPKPEPPAPTDTEARINALEDELAATKILLGVK